MEAVQQLERKQQKPPHSSIPGRAREEQMPPKQMFKVRRSANDQICVLFQVTRVTAPLLQTRITPQLRSSDLFMLAGGVIQQQLYPTAEEKRSDLELRKSTNAPSWDWGHGTFLRAGWSD